MQADDLQHAFSTAPPVKPPPHWLHALAQRHAFARRDAQDLRQADAAALQIADGDLQLAGEREHAQQDAAQSAAIQ